MVVKLVAETIIAPACQHGEPTDVKSARQKKALSYLMLIGYLYEK